MKTEDRILIRLIQECPILEILSGHWQENNQHQDTILENPAVCLRNMFCYVISLSLIAFVAELSLIFIHLYHEQLSQNVLVGFSFLAVAMFTVCMSISLKIRRSGPSIRNMREFVWAVNRIEKIVSRDFIDWDIKKIPLNLLTFLENEAHRIENLRKVRAGQLEATRRYREWKRLHQAARKLFPALPGDFDHYLPKVVSPQASSI